MSASSTNVRRLSRQKVDGMSFNHPSYSESPGIFLRIHIYLIDGIEWSRSKISDVNVLECGGESEFGL